MSAPTMRVVQFYPAELGITGDRGNVLALTARLERAGISAERVIYNVGDQFPESIDIMVIGNGPLSAMRRVSEDLVRHTHQLRGLVASGLPLLAVGGGAELLSHGVETLDGSALPGIGVLPFRVQRTTRRRVGYVVATGQHGELVGFEDHASTWTLDEKVTPYAAVIAGGGSISSSNDGPPAGESVLVHNAFATNVQGPVLPLNPQLSDFLLQAAATRKSISYERSAGHDRLDELASSARATISRIIGDKQFSYIGM
jgi:CobQ-like glutamine amidotransferase family enzyme